MPSRRADDRGWAVVLGFFAAGNLLNAAWMLASPRHWYENLPANVPASGPLNEHFVRDIGSIYLLIGVALAAGVVRRSLRLPAMLLASAFYVLHALVHVYDSARGLFEPSYVAALRRRPARKPYGRERVYRLWSLLLTELWSQLYLDRRGAALAKPSAETRGAAAGAAAVLRPSVARTGTANG